MSLIIVYVGESYAAEAGAVEREGIAVERWASYAPREMGRGSARSPSTILIRGPRISETDHSALLHRCQRLELAPLVGDLTYRLGSSVAAQVAAFGSLLPPTALLPASAGPMEVLERVKAGDVALPVLIRSEIESAAKYVGIEGCILGTEDERDIARVLSNLHDHVKNFDVLVMRQMYTVGKIATGKAVEYRAIGMRGRTLAFDWSAGSSQLPDPAKGPVAGFADQVFQRAAEVNAPDPLVVDVAVTEDGQCFIVECKNLQYSSLKNATYVLTELRRRVAQ